MRSSPLGLALALALALFLALPLLALVLTSSAAELSVAARSPEARAALALSLKTTVVSLLVIVAFGTPLAWRVARKPGPVARIGEVLITLPIVVPPAVIGIALLQAFGRQGLFGPLLGGIGLGVPFTPLAVVIAQVTVAAPFYVQAASAGFRRVDKDLLLAARTLGASPRRAFFRVAVPTALPALLAGAALSWARALGEFGATLLFAGNLSGRTQTMPLAIYSALESDVGLARALALCLTLAAFLGLVLLRTLPRKLLSAQ